MMRRSSSSKPGKQSLHKRVSALRMSGAKSWSLDDGSILDDDTIVDTNKRENEWWKRLRNEQSPNSESFFPMSQTLGKRQSPEQGELQSDEENLSYGYELSAFSLASMSPSIEMPKEPKILFKKPTQMAPLTTGFHKVASTSLDVENDGGLSENPGPSKLLFKKSKRIKEAESSLPYKQMLQNNSNSSIENDDTEVPVVKAKTFFKKKSIFNVDKYAQAMDESQTKVVGFQSVDDNINNDDSDAQISKVKELQSSKKLFKNQNRKNPAFVGAISVSIVDGDSSGQTVAATHEGLSSNETSNKEAYQKNNTGKATLDNLVLSQGNDHGNNAESEGDFDVTKQQKLSKKLFKNKNFDKRKKSTFASAISISIVDDDASGPSVTADQDHSPPLSRADDQGINDKSEGVDFDKTKKQTMPKKLFNKNTVGKKKKESAFAGAISLSVADDDAFGKSVTADCVFNSGKDLVNRGGKINNAHTSPPLSQPNDLKHNDKSEGADVAIIKKPQLSKKLFKNKNVPNDNKKKSAFADAISFSICEVDDSENHVNIQQKSKTSLDSAKGDNLQNVLTDDELDESKKRDMLRRQFRSRSRNSDFDRESVKSRDLSLLSTTSDNFEKWKLLPSSTMVDIDIDLNTPVTKRNIRRTSRQLIPGKADLFYSDIIEEKNSDAALISKFQSNSPTTEADDLAINRHEVLSKIGEENNSSKDNKSHMTRSNSLLRSDFNTSGVTGNDKHHSQIHSIKDNELLSTTKKSVLELPDGLRHKIMDLDDTQTSIICKFTEKSLQHTPKAPEFSKKLSLKRQSVRSWLVSGQESSGSSPTFDQSAIDKQVFEEMMAKRTNPPVRRSTVIKDSGLVPERDISFDCIQDEVPEFQKSNSLSDKIPRYPVRHSNVLRNTSNGSAVQDSSVANSQLENNQDKFLKAKSDDIIDAEKTASDMIGTHPPNNDFTNLVDENIRKETPGDKAVNDRFPDEMIQDIDKSPSNTSNSKHSEEVLNDKYAVEVLQNIDVLDETLTDSNHSTIEEDQVTNAVVRQNSPSKDNIPVVVPLNIDDHSKSSSIDSNTNNIEEENSHVTVFRKEVSNETVANEKVSNEILQYKNVSSETLSTDKNPNQTEEESFRNIFTRKETSSKEITNNKTPDEIFQDSETIASNISVEKGQDESTAEDSDSDNNVADVSDAYDQSDESLDNDTSNENRESVNDEISNKSHMLVDNLKDNVEFELKKNVSKINSRRGPIVDYEITEETMHLTLSNDTSSESENGVKVAEVQGASVHREVVGKPLIQKSKDNTEVLVPSINKNSDKYNERDQVNTNLEESLVKQIQNKPASCLREIPNVFKEPIENFNKRTTNLLQVTSKNDLSQSSINHETRNSKKKFSAEPHSNKNTSLSKMSKQDQIIQNDLKKYLHKLEEVNAARLANAKAVVAKKRIRTEDISNVMPVTQSRGKSARNKSKQKVIKPPPTTNKENIDFLEPDFKKPKLYMKENWITPRLYKFIQEKLRPKYDIKTRSRSEQFIKDLAFITNKVIKSKTDYKQHVVTLKKEMARLNIVETHNDFHCFVYNFLPMYFRYKAVPMCGRDDAPTFKGSTFDPILGG